MDHVVRVHKGQHRQNQALALHIKGHSVPSIRKALGYATDNGCRKAIRKAAARQEQAPIEEARNVERLHLQFLRKAVVQEMLDPSEFGETKVKAAKVALEISQRMSGLLGLDVTSTDADENAVDMWLFEVGGNVETPQELLTEEDDIDEDPDDLELDEEEEEFDG